MDLVAAADELYRLAPSEFIATRERLARAVRAEDRQLAEQIHQLRRPSLSAWALNTVSRRHADELDRLLSLGPALREAQRALAGEQLRALVAERRNLVAALLAEIRHLGREEGQQLSDQILGEVGQSLEAALADPRAAEQVRSGRLTAALSHVGFGTTDDATGAGATAPPVRQRTAERARVEQQDNDEARRSERAAEARRALDDAAEEARRATQLLDEARSVAERAAERHRRARQRIEAIESELHEAKADAELLGRDAASAERALGSAEGQAEAAHKRVAEARRHLEGSINR